MSTKEKYSEVIAEALKRFLDEVIGGILLMKRQEYFLLIFPEMKKLKK